MNSPVYALIRDAIRGRQQVIAVYLGHPREMCPHVIGTKDGREQALFYQFGGTSGKGPIVPGSVHNWRCIPIDGLTEVSVRPGEWHTAPDRPPACVDTVDLEVDG